MNKIQETFGKSRVLLPVVHCIDAVQVRYQTDLALENGADGVFLINQGGMSARDVVLQAQSLRARTFVGVNLLGTQARYVARWAALSGIRAIWSDRADLTPKARDEEGWSGLFFGGVAFKYQPTVADVDVAAREAVRGGVDVITTSGAATGSPPTVEKIATMRAALGDHALAIASGITPENVAPFLPHVDAFLVATGIEQRFGHFDAARLRALADAIHGWGR